MGVRAGRRDRDAAALPCGLAVSVIAMSGAILVGRGAAKPLDVLFDEGRYLGLLAPLVLPLVAAGLERVTAAHGALGVAMTGLLLAGIPGNLGLYREDFELDADTIVAAMASSSHLDAAARSEPGHRPALSPFAPQLAPTLVWLRDARDAGHIGSPTTTWETQAMADLMVAVSQRHGRGTGTGCAAISPFLPFEVTRGDTIHFTGPISMSVVGDHRRTVPRHWYSSDGSRLHVLAGPLLVHVVAQSPTSARRCPPGQESDRSMARSSVPR